MNKKTRRLVKKLLIFIGLLILGRLADYLPDVWWGLIIQIVVYGSALFEGVKLLMDTNQSRADITNNVIEHEKAHALAYEGGGHHIEYGTRPVTTTVHHEAVYGTRWVQDSAAYDETVVDGYVCSCGARK